ncbi:MAG: 16S rRNA (cytidine(1402)-2'-O)-methyltransferase [Patescibacteria group bacterium]
MGILYLISTPIGNLEDISLRAAKTLFSVKLILCEDTRRTGRLLEWIQSSRNFPNLSEQTRPDLLSYTDQSRNQHMDEILARLAKGQEVALVSNAGTPLLSDPGFKLVQEVIEISENFDVKVTSIPGANSLLPALQLSGLPPDKFFFLGFLPKKEKGRLELLEMVKSFFEKLKFSIIAYESPYRLSDSLGDVEKVFGNCWVTVCREMTKMHEEIYRGRVTEAQEHFLNNQPKGEVTLVIRPLG